MSTTFNLIQVPIINYAPIGTLLIYALQTEDQFARNAPYQEIYWKDAASPQGYGPFTSVTAAFEHYKYIMQLCKTPSPTAKGDSVIRVDFVNKKRVGNA